VKCVLLTLLLEACACWGGGGQCGVFCTEFKVTITANFLVVYVTSETERILQQTMQCQ
jgi:hypothetical protein